MKMHHVFGKTVTYEQVADALGMNTQTLRTTCAKKFGGNLQSFLSSKGFNKDNVDEMLSCGMIKEPVSNEKQDNDVDTVMRAIYGEDYQQANEAEQMPEKADEMPAEEKECSKNEENEQNDEEMTETESEEMFELPEKERQKIIEKRANDRALLTEINRTLEQLDVMLDEFCGIDDLMSGSEAEAFEKAYEHGYHMHAELKKLRELRFMKYVEIDWNSVAERMMTE